MKIKYIVAAAGLVAGLVGCSTTPEQLETSKSTATQSRDFPDNYQALYRKVYGPASRCLVASVGGSTQMLLDAQLYPDLGFGEMSYSMQSIYGRNYYMKLKIEKAGTGSKMTVSAGNTLVNNSRIAMVFGWADGNTGC
ncbi:hypothetical protein [Rhizobium leucaenae]|uniref:hypothetical protein n=1 Tax=Rhizobium leucaenae TaxID=29450 RepID=UPI00161F6D37|nr:hypothetical protein [Rhizobium leucaenae]MBB6304482.1 hypothetical protein [Rhizobium leucaenae]